MGDTYLYIKNMVCPRCIESVEDLLRHQKLEFTSVELGKVILSRKLSTKEMDRIDNELRNCYELT